MEGETQLDLQIDQEWSQKGQQQTPRILSKISFNDSDDTIWQNRHK